MDGFFQESFFATEFLISEEGGNPGKKLCPWESWMKTPVMMSHK